MHRLAFAIILLTACADDGADPSSEIKIVNGACAGNCIDDGDCGEGRICIGHYAAVFGTFQCSDEEAVSQPFGPLVPGTCAVDADCGNRQKCSRGRARNICVASCATSEACPSDRPHCYEGVCSACTSTSCAAGMACTAIDYERSRAGSCVAACDSTEDCPGEYCLAP